CRATWRRPAGPTARRGGARPRRRGSERRWPGSIVTPPRRTRPASRPLPAARPWSCRAPLRTADKSDTASRPPPNVAAVCHQHDERPQRGWTPARRIRLRLAGGSELHPQFPQGAGEVAGRELRLTAGYQPDAGQDAQQLLEHDPEFQPGQVGAEAKVSTESERHV